MKYYFYYDSMLETSSWVDIYTWIPWLIIHNLPMETIWLEKRTKEYYWDLTSWLVVWPHLWDTNDVRMLWMDELELEIKLQQEGHLGDRQSLLLKWDLDKYVDALVIKEIWRVQDKTDIILWTMWNDCPIIIIAEPKWDHVWMIHAGRSWIEGNIIYKTWKLLPKSKEYRVYISPMIGASDYTIHEHVAIKTISGANRYLDSNLELSDYFKDGSLRLREMIIQQLQSIWIEEKNIFCHPDSTTDDNKWLSKRNKNDWWNAIFVEFNTHKLEQ